MTVRIPLLDFPAQIAHCNAVRLVAGLPALDPDVALKMMAREWNRLLDQARARMREAKGSELADNSITHLIISRQAAPEFEAFLANLARRPDA